MNFPVVSAVQRPTCSSRATPDVNKKHALISSTTVSPHNYTETSTFIVETGNSLTLLKFNVLTPVTLKNKVFCGMTPCSSS